MNNEYMAIKMQEMVRFHACEAQKAMRDGFPNLAKHHQSMARLRYETSWQYMVALLMREPIM